VEKSQERCCHLCRNLISVFKGGRILSEKEAHARQSQERKESKEEWVCGEQANSIIGWGRERKVEGSLDNGLLGLHQHKTRDGEHKTSHSQVRNALRDPRGGRRGVHNRRKGKNETRKSVKWWKRRRLNSKRGNAR